MRKLRASISTFRRRFMLFAAAMVVAIFATAGPLAQSTYAADAIWTGNSLTYEGNTYAPLSRTGLPASDANGKTPYGWLDSVSSPQKMHVIYFDSNNPFADNPEARVSATYIVYTFTPPSNYSNSSPPVTIGVTRDLATDSNDQNQELQNTCDGSVMRGLGWILCPVSNYLADGIDMIFRIIQDFLDVRPLANDDTGIYQLWDLVRNIANACFVLVFLAIIYSHLTSAGYSNYNIKDMLPRLIIASILVNLSFWICALGVDLSNAVAHSVHAVLVNIRENMTTGADVSWTNLTTYILSGGTIAAVGLGLASSAAISFLGLGYLLLAALISVAFSVIVAFVILAARHALIIMFVVISPLAFVAFVLPSTRSLFSKWVKTYTMLMMFAVIFAFIYGVSQLAGAVIINSADGRLYIVLLGMLVQFLPLMLSVIIPRLATGILGQIANLTNDKTKGVFDRGKNWAKDNAETHRQNKLADISKRLDNKEKPKSLARLGHKLDQGRRMRERRKRDSEHVLDKENERDYNRALSNPKDPNMVQSLFRTESGEKRASDRHALGHKLEKQAELEASKVKAHSDSVWNEYLQSTKGAQYRQMRTENTSNEGINKLRDARMTEQDNSVLQERILKDADLRDVVAQTVEARNRAAGAKDIVDKQAESKWLETELNDRELYTRRVQQQHYDQEVKAAQDQWSSIIKEAASGRTDDYQGKFGPITSKMATAVDGIQAADREIAVEAFRKERADHAAKVALNASLKSDTALIQRAAGIDNDGANIVLAHLQEEGSALHMKNVGSAKSVLTNDGRYDLPMVENVIRDGFLADGTQATIVQRHAAIQRLALDIGNNYSVQDLVNFGHEIGMVADRDAHNNVIRDAEGNQTFRDIYGNLLSKDEIDTRRDTQQIINDALSKSGIKVDWYSGTDRGLSETGQYVVRDRSGNVNTAFSGSELSIAREINAGKVDNDKALGSDIDIINMQISAMADPQVRATLMDPVAAGQYADKLSEFLTDENTGMKLEKRKRGQYHILLKTLRHVSSGTNFNLADIDQNYVDVASGENVQVIDANRASTKPKSSQKRPSGRPISLT